MPEIEDYALLGDPYTAALVSTAASVHWRCPARFDPPAAFAALSQVELRQLSNLLDKVLAATDAAKVEEDRQALAKQRAAASS